MLVVEDIEVELLRVEVAKKIRHGKHLIMDRAYEGNACRAKVKKCGMILVVLPKSNHKKPWEYDRECISIEMLWSITCSILKRVPSDVYEV